MLRNARFSRIGILGLVLTASLPLLAIIFGGLEEKTLYADTHGLIEQQILENQLQTAKTAAMGVASYLRDLRSAVDATARNRGQSLLATDYAVVNRLYDSYHTTVPEGLLKRQTLDVLLALGTADGTGTLSVRSLDGHVLLTTGRTSAKELDSGWTASRTFTPYQWVVEANVNLGPIFARERALVRKWAANAYSPDTVRVRVVDDSFNLIPGRSSGIPAHTAATASFSIESSLQFAEEQAFVQVVNTARTQGKGFVVESDQNPKGTVSRPEINYVQQVPEFHSLVIADVSPGLVTAKLREFRLGFIAKVRQTSGGLQVLMLITVLLLAVLFYGYAKVIRSIRLFTASFRTAASQLEPIDVGALHYREFREAAADVNCIMEDRKRIDRSLRASEERLLQAQKMEAIGRFAGGIAHDFNNLLTVIIGYADMALMHRDLDRVGRSSLQQVRESASGAAKLTHQLLAFSRRQVLRPVVIDPNQLVENIRGMLRPIIGEDISLVTESDPHTGYFEADEGQIEQVILNLVINARDAMPDGGALTIRTKAAEMEEGLFPEGHQPEAGDYVLIEVSDDGIGMDEPTMSHLFEPFFTTKEVGKGTGLGLSTVYGIVTQSNGHVSVASVVGLGSTFRLYFPRVAVGEPEAQMCDSADSPQGSNETILVAEDEDAVRKMIVSTLKKAGYRVLEAGGGLEALSILYQTKGATIDLILSDVIMPDMTGDQLMNRLPAKHSGTPVLYMTGYDGRRDLGGAPVIHKPFSPSAVSKRIRELLDLQSAHSRSRRNQR